MRSAGIVFALVGVSQAAFNFEAYKKELTKFTPNLKHLLRESSCYLPCISSAAEKAPCNGNNLVESACRNVDFITDKAGPCVIKCGIPEVMVSGDIGMRGYGARLSYGAGKYSSSPGNGGYGPSSPGNGGYGFSSGGGNYKPSPGRGNYGSSSDGGDWSSSVSYDGKKPSKHKGYKSLGGVPSRSAGSQLSEDSQDSSPISLEDTNGDTGDEV